MILPEIRLWLDPVPRPGPEAMAVDEWLLETAEQPVLRVYHWSGEWGSLGYFGRIAAAEAAFSGLAWVRRWTGGGVVDHRADWTYSLVDPAGGPLFSAKGDASYRIIHLALSVALGPGVFLEGGAGVPERTSCFENPVRHDLVDAAGLKIAGAGQRRTKHALLHQGSVDLPPLAGDPAALAVRLGSALADRVRKVDLLPPAADVEKRVAARYGDPRWTRRR